MDYFPYPGSILSKTPTCAKDIENRIKAAHCAYGRLSHRDFNNHAISIPTKIMVFRAVVLSTLLCACETWTLYRRDIKPLENFQQRKLRQLLNTRWEMRLSNNEILKRARLPSVEATILQHHLRWAGHVVRMDPSRLSGIMLYGELNEGTRPHGIPKLWYKDQLKCSLKQAGINLQSWKQLANHRVTWRRKIRDGAESFETARKQQDEDRRKRRHEKLNQPRPLPSIPCDHCQRLFHHRLGLQSHIRHRHQPQMAKP